MQNRQQEEAGSRLQVVERDRGRERERNLGCLIEKQTRTNIFKIETRKPGKLKKENS